MVTVFAVIGVLWVVGRISRRSPNHPVNAVPVLLVQQREYAAAPSDPGQETAQIQGSLVVGEGGGE